MVVHPEVSCVWLKFGFISSSSHLSLTMRGGGGLVCDSFGRSEMMSAQFDGKQSRHHVHQPSTSIRLPICLIWIPMASLTHLVCFLFFLKRTAAILAPRLAVVFRRLLRLSSLHVCWRVANVTTIKKGSTFLLIGQLRTNFFLNTYTVRGF